MGKLLQSFDATQYDPSQGMAQMPLGKHPVVIETSSVETTSKGDSGMVVFGLRIIDGPQKGAGGAYRLNLYNQSAKASEIAHRQLSALSYVTGVFKVDATEQLHGIPFVVEVGLQRDPEAAAKGYTEVQRVYDMNGNEPGKGGQGNPGVAQPQGFQQQQPQQPAAQGGGWGAGQTTQQPQQQPAPNGAWGQQPAQQQPQQQQPAAAGGGWGQQPAQQQPAAAGGGWGQQPAQQQPAQHQPNNGGGGWQQQPQGGAPAGGPSPWGR